MSRQPEDGPPQKLVVNLALSLAVTALLAGGLEGAARLIESRRPPPPPVADYIWDWAQKWEGDFYTMRSSAVGWPPWEEFNADGLRDRIHAEHKPEGVRRVICLGDSVTFGHGLPASQAFPQLLQQRLDREGPGVEVFNLALWGWSTRQQRIAYRTIGRKYQPDDVVLGVCLNDIAELQNNLARPPRWLTRLHGSSALVRLVVDAPGREIRNVEELFEAPDSTEVREGFARLFSEIEALRDEVREDGARLAVVIFPFRFQLSADAPAPTAQERILEFCASSGIECLDMLPGLEPLGEEAFLDYDHLSLVGSRRTAEALQASRLVPEPLSVLETLAAASVTATRERADVAGLVRALGHDRVEVRRAAAWALGRHGADVSTAVPALESALRDAEEPVRAEAAMALGRLGERGRGAIQGLFKALGDQRQRVRWEAARALWRLRPTAENAVEPLAACLKSPDRYVRAFAAWTLGQLGPAARGAVPALIEALAQEEAYGRGGAALALSRMGTQAREAVPALLVGLASEQPEQRWRAARAIGRIGVASEGVVDRLAAALADPDERVRAHAAKALGRMGSAATAAAEALARAASDPKEPVRSEAREALRRISG